MAIEKETRRFKWIPRWVSPQLIIFLLFLGLMLFVGENSFVNSKGYNDQINELKAQIKSNEDSAVVYEGKVNELNTDRETLEKIAREKYGMKRTNEDVYVTDIP